MLTYLNVELENGIELKCRTSLSLAHFMLAKLSFMLFSKRESDLYSVNCS